MFHVMVDGILHPSDNLPPTSTNENTIKRRERRKKSKMNCDDCKPSAYNTITYCNPFLLAPLDVPCPRSIADMFCKQEGTTPMRYNDNYATANATVQSQPTDTAVTRDYLLGRLAKADYPKEAELRKFFNLYVDNTPKTYKDMIAIIQAGTYTIDPKIAKRIDDVEAEDDDKACGFGYGPMYGIIWPGPVADYVGYKAASTEKEKQYRAAKDAVMVSDAATGLAAIQAFEAWMPTPATPAS